MVKIAFVENGSLAMHKGICEGDVLISINGNEIVDVLDYRFYLAERNIKLLLSRDGEEYTVSMRKGQYDDIGLGFETPLMDKKHSCKNACIFCFIDQNPEGLRSTLYFKDDDSRLSFIHGNYITLTNLTDKDVDRIVKMRFSPINISVHTTNPDLRVKMMKNKNSGKVLSYLKRFYDAGISMCAQIVLCKGVNDGDELLRTMRDLAEYFPYMSSVAIVPAGLTKFRDKLYPLTDFTKEEAEGVIDMVDAFANEHKRRCGSRLFYVADEFYLKASRPIPTEDYYEDYPQIENGVGLIRSFSDEFGYACEDIAELSDSLVKERHVGIVTGVASYPTISQMAQRIMSISPKIRITVYKVINKFFGESITVSGLLTGKDICEQLEGRLECEEIILPAQALRKEELDFLCGMKLSELEERLGVRAILSESNGYDFIDAIFGR